MKPEKIAAFLVDRAAAKPRAAVIDAAWDAAAFEDLVLAEVAAARAEHPPYANEFVALGVILEELDEFKEWVWKRRSERDALSMLGELVQVAATCRMASAECGYLPHPKFAAAVSELISDGSGTAVHTCHDGYARILVEVDRFKDGVSKATDPKFRRNALVSAAWWAAATAIDLDMVGRALRDAQAPAWERVQ